MGRETWPVSYMVPPLGAYKSQLGGHIFYCSTSTVIIRLYIYVIFVYSSCLLIVGVFARQMHSTSEFAMIVLSKCVTSEQA